ncbi:hypothetical protein P3W24_13585 [Luteibacter sp. PPL201]|jgi:hypothetical protein|uniref:ATP-grasp domain-containing protein n=1 Tax=Luteibacter sahnii TaxID=3021977 RepID=A0ABT6BD67_9GAMM|nr:hypothetical protein [Luteibacter sp. PPL193]MDY1549897.1 hypothetical protein [Luteibacter sp. PPL193]
MKRPLILAPDIDPHACAAAWALERQGVTPLWMPSLQARPGVHYTFHIANDALSLEDSLRGDDRIGAVWNRRLHDPAPHCADADRTFAEWEWKLFQRGLFSIAQSVGDALWINPLPAAQRAELKLVQLDACRRLGIPFPDTVVTTDAEQVDALRRRWGRIVFKSFLVHHWEESDSGRMHAVGVTLLDDHSDLPPEAIAVCPGIYQRYIEKAADVRVTVMGERMFALKLTRRAGGGGFVDWRGHAKSGELLAQAFTLPGDVEQKLRALMRELNLVFGAVDLVIDREGGYHFLEVNQAGQFLFIEEMAPEYPILRCLTAMLLTGRTDAPLEAVQGVDMASFRQSEAIEALGERISERPPERPLLTIE